VEFGIGRTEGLKTGQKEEGTMVTWTKRMKPRQRMLTCFLKTWYAELNKSKIFYYLTSEGYLNLVYYNFVARIAMSSTTPLPTF
jgi:hypothetical protein